MKYEASTVEEYISQVPEERQEILQKLSNLIKENLPEGFEEGINYNMIGYYVPHSKYPDGYHCDPNITTSFYEFGFTKKLNQLIS